jgi:hypothetical protein
MAALAFRYWRFADQITSTPGNEDQPCIDQRRSRNYHRLIDQSLLQKDQGTDVIYSHSSFFIDVFFLMSGRENWRKVQASRKPAAKG